MIPSLRLSVLPLPPERADEVAPFAAEAASVELTKSAPRGEMTEEVDETSGTIIQKGFPSHLRVLELEADDTSRRATGWDLYRKFGDPSTQNDVEDLHFGKKTAGLQGMRIVYHTSAPR